MIERLYELYFKELVGFCSAMAKDQATAEDLVQEAFLKALRNMELLEELKEKQCRAWLYRTVKNLYLDRLRHAKYETIAECIPKVGKTADGYEESDQKQLLNQLPEEERILFRMRYLEGYNSKELGELFSMPAATVRMKLASARKKLKKEWEE